MRQHAVAPPATFSADMAFALVMRESAVGAVVIVQIGPGPPFGLRFKFVACHVNSCCFALFAACSAFALSRRSFDTALITSFRTHSSYAGQYV